MIPDEKLVKVDFTSCWIVEIDDPVTRNITRCEKVAPGQTVNDLIRDGKIVLDQSPIITIRNSKPLLEASFDEPLEPGDVITLLPQPGWIFETLLIINLVITAVLTYISMTADPGNIESGDGRSPTYTTSYKGNQRRPNEPLPCVYGQIRTYPDITAQFPVYDIDGKQELSQLFDVTVGDIEDLNLDKVWYGETPITAFSDVEVELIRPGETSEIFTDQVFQADTVGNIEIIDAGLTGAHVVNPSGTLITDIYADITAPQGAYFLNHKGSVFNSQVKLAVYYRLVGSGTWIDGTDIIHVPTTTNPWRTTIHIKNLTAGRYEVALWRRDPPTGETTMSDKIIWESLRGSIKDETTTITSRVAVRIRTDESVGNAALGQFSLRVQRRLPIYNGSSFETPQYTRHALSAFIDILRAEYGGNLPDSRIDLDGLYAIEARTPNNFDAVFDRGMSVWEALGMVARVVLGRPAELPGGVYTIIPDDPAAAPVSMYTMRQIVESSMRVEYRQFTDDAYDSVRVTFKDETQDYRDQMVLCTPSGSTDSNINDIEMFGVTTEDGAYEVGIRQANEIRWRRKSIAFETGIEGFIPRYPEVIKVHHYLLGLEQSKPSISGEVKSHSGSTLTVFEDLSAIQGSGGLVVWLRNLDGSPQGPLSCSVPSANQISISSGFNSSPLVYGDNVTGPLYAIGDNSDFYVDMRVFNVADAGNGNVRIEGVEDNPNVYIKGDVPTLPGLKPGLGKEPLVTNLAYEILGDTGNPHVQLSWSGQNSEYYLVEVSTDNANWSELATPKVTYYTDIPVEVTGVLYYRVRGMAAFAGVPQTVVVDLDGYALGLNPAQNFRLARPFDYQTVELAWDPFPPGQYAVIDVEWNWAGGVAKGSFVQPEGAGGFIFRRTMAIQIQTQHIYGQRWPAEGARRMQFSIYPVLTNGNDSGELSARISIDAHNEQCTKLENVVWQESGPNLIISFDMPEDDAAGITVHMSETQGFTPSEENVVHRGSETNFTLPDVLGPHPYTCYLRMTSWDQWGVFDDLTYSLEEEVYTTADGGLGIGDIEWPNVTDPDGTKPEDNATETDLTSVLLDPMFSKTLALNNSNRYWEGVSPGGVAKVIDDGVGNAILEMSATGGYNIVRGQKYFDATAGTKFTITSRFAWNGLANRIDARLVAFEYDENFTQVATFNMLNCTLVAADTWLTKAAMATVSANTKTRYVKFGWLIGPDNSSGGIQVSYIRLMGTGAVDWQDTFDDGTGSKPDDYANVTIDNLPGDGYNRIPPTYQSFSSDEFFPYIAENTSKPSNRLATTVAGGLYGEGAMGLANNQPEGTGAGTWDCRMAATTGEYNILIEPGFRYIISFVSNGDNAWAHGRIFFRGSQGGLHFPKNIQGMDGNDGSFTTYNTTAWKDHVCYLDFESSSETALVMVVGQTDSYTNDIYFDGFFMEAVRSSSATLEIEEPQNRSPFRGFSKNAIKTRHLIPEAVTGVFAVGPSSQIALASSQWTALCSVDITYMEDSILVIKGTLSTVAGLNGDLLLSVRFYIDNVLQDPAYIKPAFSGISQTQSQIISEISYITPGVQSDPIEVRLEGRSSGIATTAEVEGTTLTITEHRR